jgi:hypothetical protein
MPIYRYRWRCSKELCIVQYASLCSALLLSFLSPATELLRRQSESDLASRQSIVVVPISSARSFSPCCDYLGRLGGAVAEVCVEGRGGGGGVRVAGVRVAEGEQGPWRPMSFARRPM